MSKAEEQYEVKWRRRQEEERHEDDRRTLERCFIAVVPSSAKERRWEGRLEGFEIRRAFRRGYWVVSGAMPLFVARLLFSHPIGRTDIRVAGHCGCPPPEHPWVDWFVDGVRLFRDEDGSQEAEWRRYVGKGLIPDEPTLFAPNPADVYGAVGVVSTYHVDTEVGLYVLSDAIRENAESVRNTLALVGRAERCGGMLDTYTCSLAVGHAAMHQFGRSGWRRPHADCGRCCDSRLVRLDGVVVACPSCEAARG